MYPNVLVSALLRNGARARLLISGTHLSNMSIAKVGWAWEFWETQVSSGKSLSRRDLIQKEKYHVEDETTVRFQMCLEPKEMTRG